jgi:hypothetical protein
VRLIVLKIKLRLTITTGPKSRVPLAKLGLLILLGGLFFAFHRQKILLFRKKI